MTPPRPSTHVTTASKLLHLSDSGLPDMPHGTILKSGVYHKEQVSHLFKIIDIINRRQSYYGGDYS